MNHQKHTHLRTTIEYLKKDLKASQTVLEEAQADVKFFKEALEQAEKEFSELDLEDEEPTEEENEEKSIEDRDTRMDLEDMQR